MKELETYWGTGLGSGFFYKIFIFFFFLFSEHVVYDISPSLKLFYDHISLPNSYLAILFKFTWLDHQEQENSLVPNERRKFDRESKTWNQINVIFGLKFRKFDREPKTWNQINVIFGLKFRKFDRESKTWDQINVIFGLKFVSESKIVASWNIFRILYLCFRTFSPNL